MKHGGWFKRLAGQCPGWWIWYTSGTVTEDGRSSRGWYAIPIEMPPTIEERAQAHVDYRHVRIGPFATPQELRTEMQARYGAGEHCDTCGAPWELCGHRQPERERTRP